uniref:6-bladed beta-propeller n=1 Tax=Parabacteroides pacaensis TaxID=2086575 RepID=UPI00131EA88C|nr:6-bladed beta-propeller [Parabacteroides pacaensis]
MKKKLIITATCVLALLFSSFKGNAQKAGINSKGVKTITLSSIKESFQDTVYFKEPQAIVLETTEESLMTSIRRIFMDDNRLFIYDRQLHNIFIFDITGKYISKIDSKGQGPREYSQICDFTIDPIKKHIILLCDIPEKRMYFTYDGTFIKEESLNRLFIYDRQLHNIFIFDITGKYISKIDSKGQGPGEYSQICDFTIDPIKKHIILLCDIPEKRMYFTYDGTFIKEESLPDFYLKLTTDGNYIYFEKGILEANDYQLHILNTKTGKKQERLKALNIKNNFYTPGNLFSQGKDILYVRRYDYSIYELKNGEIAEKYHIDFKKHSFPDRLMIEEEARVISNECSKYDYIFSMTSVIDNDNYMMFYTNRGICLYDKKNNVLMGYKQMINSTLGPMNYPFTFYFLLENTNKIVCSIEDPSFIKRIAKRLTEHSDEIEIKKVKKEHPEYVKVIMNLGSKMTDDNNPVLFIYEFKD